MDLVAVVIVFLAGVSLGMLVMLGWIVWDTQTGRLAQRVPDADENRAVKRYLSKNKLVR